MASSSARCTARTAGTSIRTGSTQAYAIAARKAGAEIHRFTRVIALKPRPDGGWRVITDKGEIVCEHVVNAAGLWAREVGRMVGIELPVLAMEHMYIVTEDIPEVIAFGREIAPDDRLLAARYTCARSARRADGDLRAGLPSMVALTRRRGTSACSSCRTISTGCRAISRSDSSISRPIGRRRNQEGRQRSLHVRARRQSAGRAGARLARTIWCRLRRDGRIRAGRGRRSGAVAVDGGRRSRLRSLGDGCRPLWCIRDAGLHEYQGAGELSAPLSHCVSQRGVAGRSSVATHAGLRPVAGRGRRVRRQFRPRSSALVCARRAWTPSRFRHTAVPMPSPSFAKNATRCAMPSASWRYRGSASMKSSGPAPHAWLNRVLAGKVPAAGSHGARADAERGKAASSATFRLPAWRMSVSS